MDRLHTDREYEAELTQLRDQVLVMSATVEDSLTAAVQAFRDRDPRKAAVTSALDSKIDQMEIDIDNACLHILARRQPVASDLRFITTTLKVVTDLERIGDLANNICERVEELGSARPIGAPQLDEMADISKAMLRDALDAFVAKDAKKAHLIGARDGRVDQLYAEMFPVVVKYMSENPEDCDSAMRFLSIAKYLERVADHSTNLAEMVIFMIEGEDVRHLGKKAAT